MYVADSLRKQANEALDQALALRGPQRAVLLHRAAYLHALAVETEEAKRTLGGVDHRAS